MPGEAAGRHGNGHQQKSFDSSCPAGTLSINWGSSPPALTWKIFVSIGTLSTQKISAILNDLT